ncbi:Uma2 family endonuclease [Streptomyces sp. 4N509B]|uniref:Uma2 family endonuclease n=1 Tax=Streptomyces sp. 4N509B TaxID=3457413 RepID=UPI003FD526E1
MTTAEQPLVEPMTESKSPQRDPIDLLIAIEEAWEEPIRPECIEGMVVVPPQPDDDHNQGAAELYFQLRSAGITLAGLGNGYRSGRRGERTRNLVVPDFYVQRRKPTDIDEAYRAAHQGWYPIDMLALVGEITSTNHEIDTGPKYRTYAAAGVPVYVLVNREDGHAYAHTDPVPDETRYRTTTTVKLGEKLPLPEPYPALDTSVVGGGLGDGLS